MHPSQRSAHGVQVHLQRLSTCQHPSKGCKLQAEMFQCSLTHIHIEAACIGLLHRPKRKTRGGTMHQRRVVLPPQIQTQNVRAVCRTMHLSLSHFLIQCFLPCMYLWCRCRRVGSMCALSVQRFITIARPRFLYIGMISNLYGQAGTTDYCTC